jgi:hypothetical protein
MINESKPITIVPETYLNIGDGFNLLVGGIYKLITGASAANGMTNSSKASIGTTWDTWTTSWDDETRTWDELSQLLVNDGKPTTSITNFNKP